MVERVLVIFSLFTLGLGATNWQLAQSPPIIHFFNTVEQVQLWHFICLLDISLGSSLFGERTILGSLIHYLVRELCLLEIS